MLIEVIIILGQLCTNTIKLLKKVQPCYQRVRTIVKKLDEMKQCIRWLEEWEKVHTSKNSDKLQILVQEPQIPANLKRIFIRPTNASIHKHSNVRKKLGRWIDAYKKKISDNRVIPCFVCQTLHSNKTVSYYEINFKNILDKKRKIYYRRIIK